MLEDITQPPIVPTESPTPPAAPSTLSTRHRRHLLWAIPLAVVGIGFPLVVSVASMKNSDRWVDAPGDADAVADVLAFTELPPGVTRDERESGDGKILFVTVNGPRLTALQLALLGGEANRTSDRYGADAAWDSDVRMLSRLEKFGDATPSQQREIVLQMMRDAKDVAEYVAYRRLGFDAELKAGEVVVAGIVCRNGEVASSEACDTAAPAGDVLERGSTIVAIDGTPTPTLDDLDPIMATKKPGDTVTVRYRSPLDDKEREATFATIASPDDPTKALIGIIRHDTYSVDLPFEATIDTNSIGGPSAGLAFTLTLIDELSPGSLTGPSTVAVTGTIDEQGNVGAIGGLHQKTVAARRRGADLFIVPTAQGEADIAGARAVAGDMEVVPVETLEQAVDALAARGGTPIPPVPSTSS
jgi:PDZ domain-containing protein